MGKFLKRVYKVPSAFKFLHKIENDGYFTHGLYKAIKKKQNPQTSQWFVKFIGDKRIEALAEVLTQEMMRLILPQQPKTRRMINITQEHEIHYYILSKEIPQFNGKFFLSSNNNVFVLDGSVTGLAASQVLALWLNEVDFKVGNVGINQLGQVIKIDGGLSFITLNPNYEYLHDKDYRITSNDLEALPNLIHYSACNWLHHIQWNPAKFVEKKEPTAFDKRINQNVAFRNEVYKTILQIISLPDELIRFFTHNYITKTADVTRFSNFMIERKQQLEDAANKISGFKKYRLSNQGQNELFKFLNDLKNFKTMEKIYLLEEFRRQYGINPEALIIEKEIIFYLNYLKNSTNNYLISSSDLEKHAFLNDLTIFLKKLETYIEDFAINDPIVSNLIESIQKIVEYKNQLLIAPKKPIPTPRNTKKIPSFTSSFFNEKQINSSEINQSIATKSNLY